MNYPLQSLTIIAPILFIVLMIGIPAIGVFAGWKRAAYWGGGTLFFFIIGMIVWTTAGTAIVNLFINQLTNLLKDMGVSPTPKALASLCAPIFFLIVMMIGELILLINYYAWFKKVSKIKQDIQVKKAYKMAKKTSKKASKKGVRGWSAMQLTGQGRAINMACGGVGLTLLLLPSTITFTQAIMYTTTSVNTRANSAFCSNLYNGLEKFNKAFSWMSYYGAGNTATDFNSLFSGLSLYSKKMVLIDPLTGEPEKERTVIDCVGQSMGNGIKNVVEKATNQPEGSTPQQQIDNVATAVNNFAKSWNNIIEQNATDVGVLFQSSNITEMIQETIKTFVQTPLEITDEQVDSAYGEGSMFKTVVEQLTKGYQEGQESITVTISEGVSAAFTALKSIPVTTQAFENIKNSFFNVIKIDQLNPAHKEKFNTALTDIVSMLFYVE